ncbi:hypothetical protein PR202_gb10880 [Eleusine coracana subsp. coracana]|uniref:WRKY domain-containing protein n=1 Tax=Eleusine coracana subsp. coracana TaxID=191504 RepID=A0AAV5EL43_ELECO|nr:hypothetical protein PR202_gb10880 [Eleusine coracana subsp. coracana]
MDDRRGRGGDPMRQRPFASAQERVFDGGGNSAGPGPAFGGDFDQGSSYMALLGAGVNPQPSPLQWAVDEVTASPAINLVPQSFPMVQSLSSSHFVKRLFPALLPEESDLDIVQYHHSHGSSFHPVQANYNTSSSSYQHPASFAAVPPLGYSSQPYAPSYLQHADPPPPPQWPPRSTAMPSASSLIPANFSFLPTAPPHNQPHHIMQPRAAALGFGGAAPAAAVIEQPAKDGYSWRKYGQKQLKDAESPRSYYKCTREGCPVKKVVERSFDGFITEITYKGRHNHPRPPQRGNDAGGDVPAGMIAEEAVDGQSDDDDDDVFHEDHDGEEGRAIMGAAGQRVVKKPKIILQTPSDVDLLDDGYRWRKYGQKVVKGNPRPRSYYKCTADHCNVRKQIERASTAPRCVLTPYTGRHNHDPPVRGPAAAAGRPFFL